MSIHARIRPQPMMLNVVAPTMSEAERRRLQDARRHLEHPSFAARLTSVVGTPIEMGLKLLPPTWYAQLHRSAEAMIRWALEAAIAHLQSSRTLGAREAFYRCVGMGTGALGGFFGGPALLLELPITTAVMLSAIAAIARDEGEDLDDLDTRLACLEVFALGGRSQEDDAADTGYYGLRLALEIPMANASRHITEYGFGRQAAAPALVDFILVVSERFGVTVTEKAAAELIPVIGALGGACLNAIFIQHFQHMARAHFSIRGLERKYGKTYVEAEYQRMGGAKQRAGGFSQHAANPTPVYS